MAADEHAPYQQFGISDLFGQFTISIGQFPIN